MIWSTIYTAKPDIYIWNRPTDGVVILCHLASATVVPCVTTLVSGCGSADQKGTIMGIFRSLGALARALGPIIASTGMYFYI